MRGDLVKFVELLVLVVEALISKDHQQHFGESILSRLCDIVLDFFFKAIDVSLVFELNPVGLLNSNAELNAGLSQRFIDIVGSVVVAASIATLLLGALVAHDPLLVKEINTLLDGQSSQNILINVNHLIFFENLRRGKDSLVSEVDWVALNSDVPVFEHLLLHEKAHTVVDLSHLLLWIHSADGKAVAHARAGSDGLGDAIDSTEFRRQVDQTVSVLDDDQRLVEVCDCLVVDLRHVLSDTDLLLIIHELGLCGVGGEIYPADDVGPLVSPVSDH